MQDGSHSEAVLSHAPQRRDHLSGSPRVEAAGGVVDEQDLWKACQLDAYAQPPPLSKRDAAHAGQCGALSDSRMPDVRESEHAKQPIDQLGPFVRRDLCGETDGGSEVQSLLDGKEREECVVLRDKAEQRLVLAETRPLPIEQDGAFGGGQPAR